MIITKQILFLIKFMDHHASHGIEYFWYRPRSYSLFLLSGLPIVFLAYSKLVDKKI